MGEMLECFNNERKRSTSTVGMTGWLYFSLPFKKTEVQLIYNIVFVSGKQSDLVIHICNYITF